MSRTSALELPSKADREQGEIARGCETEIIDALANIGTEAKLTMQNFECELCEIAVARCTRAGFSVESVMFRLNEVFTQLRPLVLRGKVSSPACKAVLRPIIGLLLEARLRLLAMPPTGSWEEERPIIHTPLELKNESSLDYQKQYPKYRWVR